MERINLIPSLLHCRFVFEAQLAFLLWELEKENICEGL